jgi:hypothetical protein
VGRSDPGEVLIGRLPRGVGRGGRNPLALEMKADGTGPAIVGYRRFDLAVTVSDGSGGVVSGGRRCLVACSKA